MCQCGTGDFSAGLASLDLALDRANRQHRSYEYVREIQVARDDWRKRRFLHDEAAEEESDVLLRTFMEVREAERGCCRASRLAAAGSGCQRWRCCALFDVCSVTLDRGLVWRRSVLARFGRVGVLVCVECAPACTCIVSCE